MPNMLTLDQFRRAAGLSDALANRWFSPLVVAMTEFNIDTPQRQAAFISQIRVESTGFTRVTENFNYSPEGLLATFPSQRINRAQAYLLGRQRGEKVVPQARQEQIANLVYGGRYGNDRPGDGWRYRGQGLKQLTFYDNYLRCGHALELDLIAQPELLQHDDLAARSAGWFWYANKCNVQADAGNITLLTRIINGGANGLERRNDYYKQAFDVLCR